MAAERKATPIDNYLRTVPGDRRGALEDLRAKIRSVVPDSEECISYGMPAFRLPGGVVAGFQATKNGGSYYPFTVVAIVWLASACGGVTEVRHANSDDAEPGRSCMNLAASCGPSGDADCCSSSVVPGGTFYRNFDGVVSTDRSFPATVSSFRLDTYEITVGRFRNFVAAYSPNMIDEGAGRNPNNPDDPGWELSFNPNLPADAAALVRALDCGVSPKTWTDSPGPNEDRPMNCLSWYEVFAFCIWDGGRIPTEAEWNYAAAGGSEQRAYPWGGDAPDCTYANYKGASGGTDYCVEPGIGSTNGVGSESPKGDGRWGQADLAGNLTEWTLDWDTKLQPELYPTPCSDCAVTSSGSYRMFRGGGYDWGADAMAVTSRGGYKPALHEIDHGARCVRTP